MNLLNLILANSSQETIRTSDSKLSIFKAAIEVE